MVQNISGNNALDARFSVWNAGAGNSSLGHSFAMELLHDARKTNKRQFIIILVILGMFTALLGYTIWLLNDINYVETSEVYDMNTENGNNNYVGGDNNGNIENN